MTKQHVRFNYFVPELNYENGNNFRWNMKDFLEFLLNHKGKIESSVILGDEVADLEWEDQQLDQQRNLYWFRISKNRYNNIPSLKHLNKPGKPIELDKDEFVGEFSIFVFDPESGVLVVQSNFYGLTTKQSELALTELRQRYKESIGEGENEVGVVSLKPIPDESAYHRALQNQIIRRINIKASDVSLLNDEHMSAEVMHKAVDAAGEIGGISFDLTVSMSRTPRARSLEKDQVTQVIEDIKYLAKQGKDVSMQIASKEDEHHAIETIDLLSPRLKSSMTIEFPNRETPGAEFIYNNFVEQNFDLPQDNLDKNSKNKGFRQRAARAIPKPDNL